MDAAVSTLDPGPAPARAPGEGSLEARWLGRLAYRDAWALQHELVERRIAGGIPDQLLLLEHPAVLTLGRHADDGHVRASPAELVARGIEVVRVERGGEVTYHGPGQLVAYPILALSRRGLLLRPLVRALEAAMVATCAAFGVTAGRREGHPGCWCDPEGPAPRKIGALGIRVERGVSYHGIALNVDPDLSDFDLIDPCGMPGVISTSIASELRRSWADLPDHAHGGITPDLLHAEPAPAEPAPAGFAPAGFAPANAPTGIAMVTGSPHPNVSRAADVFARALAEHLGAELVGFGAADPAAAPAPGA